MIRPDRTWFLAFKDSSSRRTCARISSTEGGAWGSGSGNIASIFTSVVFEAGGDGGGERVVLGVVDVER